MRFKLPPALTGKFELLKELIEHECLYDLVAFCAQFLLSNQCICWADGIWRRAKGPVIVDLCEQAWLIASCAVAYFHSLLRAARDLEVMGSHGWAQDSPVQTRL